MTVSKARYILEHKNNQTETKVKAILNSFIESIAPKGNWKHIGISKEWEDNNKNPLKGKTGHFEQEGTSFIFQSKGTEDTFFITPKKIQTKGNKLIIQSTGNLEYEFERV